MAGPRPGSQPDIESRDNLNLAGAQQTADSIEELGATVRTGAEDLCAKDLGAKAISCAGKNLQASLDDAQSPHAATQRWRRPCPRADKS